MSAKTSARHTAILDNYLAGDSRFNDWAREKLGDFRLMEWRPGALRIDWAVDERFIMPDGVMFGGHVSSVADHVLGLAAMTVLEEDDERFMTSSLETVFFRPIGMPRAGVAARVVNTSRALIHVEAEFFNADDKLAARATAVQVRRRRS